MRTDLSRFCKIVSTWGLLHIQFSDLCPYLTLFHLVLLPILNLKEDHHQQLSGVDVDIIC